MMADPVEKIIGAASGTNECPFPGLHSYDLDRQTYFKGREQETIELAQRVLANRLTVLTAGSGDGKTSLIHAGIVPLLLGEGYEVAVAEPGGQDPLLAVAGAALERLLPIGGSNVVLVDWLEQNYPGDSLRDKRARLLDERRAGVRNAPWSVDRPLDQFQGGPLWTWLISETCDDALVDRAMKAVSRLLEEKGVWACWPGLEAPLPELRDFFLTARSILERPWLDLTGKPMEALDSVLADLAQAIELRAATPGFALVLFIDQLEEIFVQFRGGPASSTGGSQPWRQKQALLELLFEIRDASDWPIRLVLSLRKEHYADLQSAFPDQELLAANTYHLAPLRREQALVTLHQLKPVAPEAAAAGEASEGRDAAWDQFLEEAVNALVAEREGKWVDATELSSFGRWLWHKPVPADAREAVSGALLSQVRAMLEVDAGNTTINSPARRQEALEILSTLIIPAEGGGGRRISLPEQSLRAAPGRSDRIRNDVLSYLTRSKLLRVETRDGHGYYAIVHERIIAVLDELTREWHKPELADLSRILEALRERCLSTLFSPPALSRYDVTVLAANLERLDVSDFFAARLLDGLLAQRDWDGDLARPENAAFLRLLTYLRDQAARESARIEPANAAQLVEQAMRRGELASPVLASRHQLPADSAQGRQQARWLITSSLVRTDPCVEDVESWADMARNGASDE